MDKIIPLISSGVAGPLGLLHLPRLWQKALLASTGQLADGYKDIGTGYDFMVLGAIGIDPDAARAYIHTEKPTYVQFEAWITAQPGAKVDSASISASNNAVLDYNHTPAARTPILVAAKLPDNVPIRDAVS